MVRTVLYELQALGTVQSRPNEDRSRGSIWQKVA
jgi:hypothetical protein